MGSGAVGARIITIDSHPRSVIATIDARSVTVVRFMIPQTMRSILWGRVNCSINTPYILLSAKNPKRGGVSLTAAAT